MNTHYERAEEAFWLTERWDANDPPRFDTEKPYLVQDRQSLKQRLGLFLGA